ncbi:uncharacterized protein TRIADDRAFT_19407 [Trichoplax adhaerens]|uniref:Peptidase M20 domain-containing protein 2 n=1 Tax=Trichoplax adhaerens TaxID=10228 RepID=B3RLE5_TRIAD|nr:hypothetical protein TRIADDRAFT_19407 [Trichoplax adhaerens]EDV29530.1 hypothetical protein TRIADDRAFT_19407 [Trichoplax adhaerens]|eukprot:XP_002108732.1 hypothetical protein TRIADDRAFT_19407 [Trichoplax adhaerens]
MSVDELKKVAIQAIDERDGQLFDINQQLHKNPELLFEEHKAHDLLTNYLEKEGFQVDRGHVIPTAFRATFARGKGPKMCIICEYDALPEIGHACGHNLIAEAGIGAAVGIKAAIESSQNDLGQVVVYGTPAEEGGGGKITMIKEGCFDDIDVAMMVHPCTYEAGFANVLAHMSLTITYEGQNAHASAYPWEGINALDAAVQAYVNISTMRQQFKPSWRIHGIIADGGVKPNIIPSKTVLEYGIRAPTDAEIQELRRKCEHCFQSAAEATGCSVQIVFNDICGDYYAPLLNNLQLVEMYERNAESFGMKFPTLSDQKTLPAASTDMGNISRVVASIQPYYTIGSSGVNHTIEFAEASASEFGHRQTIIAAKSMAMTCLEVMTNPELLVNIKSEFHSNSKS